MKHSHSVREKLQAGLNRVGALVAPGTAPVAVFCVDDDRMRELGTYYPKPHGPVFDVLAFPEGERLPGERQEESSLGVIYINEQLYADNAEYMMFLGIHGFLHLLGYRHDGKHDTIAMEKMERFLWLRALSSAWI